jgi:hypothetical protein
MKDQYQLRTMRQAIPAGSDASSIAAMVRGILRLPFQIAEINISARKSQVEWKAYVPKSDPPDGVVLDPPPSGITELLARIELEELSGAKVSLNLRSLAIVSKMMLAAAKKRPDQGAVSGMTGIAWLVGSMKSFCSWMGIKPSSPPSKFFGMPLIEHDELPADRLVLLCGREAGVDHLEAEAGFIVAMIRKKKEKK